MNPARCSLLCAPLPVIATVLALATPARAEGPRVVAVFSIENNVPALRPADVETLTEVIATRMTASGVFKVVPKSDLKRALSEQKRTSFDRCYDESCQIEVGKEVAATLSLASRLSALGSRCLLTLTLYDLKQSASAGAAMAEGGCAVDDVLATVKAAVDQLVGAPGPARGGGAPGGFDVRAEEARQAERAAREADAERAWSRVEALASAAGVPARERLAALDDFLARAGFDSPRRGEAERLRQRFAVDAASGLSWIQSLHAGVELTRSEVTVAEYGRCASAGACDASRVHGTEYAGKDFGSSSYCNWGERAQRGDHPINCVTWGEADAFCRWAGGRLPTAEEWGAEASAGGLRIYPWGSESPTCARAVMQGEGNDGCGRDSTWPVCSRPAGNSASGLCDMGGNLWEWTSTEQGGERVNLGASWIAVEPARFEARARSSDVETYRGNGMGFRCAREPARSSAPRAASSRVDGRTGLTWVASAPAGVAFTRTEVTVAEYSRCAEAGACSAGRLHGTERTENGGGEFSANSYCNWSERSGRSDHPVNCVTWDEADAFCRWAGGRLPSVDEWMLEAFAGGTRTFPWGEDEPSCARVVMHGEGNDGCGRDSTWPVCAKGTSGASGLCDLGGNVSEWTRDAAGQNRVKVGGTWLSKAADRFRRGATSPDVPGYRGNGVGFRCVR